MKTVNSWMSRFARRAAAEEPDMVGNDPASESRLINTVHFVQVVRLGREGGLRGPLRVRQAVAEGPVKLVRARLGQRADDSSGEPSVLGGDASRKGRDLLDRVLDEEVVGLSPQVLSDDDAVHEEEVVVGGSARDRDLVVDSVGADARHDEDRAPDRPGDRQLAELLARQVRSDLGRLEHGGRHRLAGDRYLLLDLGDGQIGVGPARFGQQKPLLPGDRLKPLVLEGDRVVPGRESPEIVNAVGAGRRLPRPLKRRRRHRHGDVWQGLPIRSHRARDCGCRPLSPRPTGRQKQTKSRQENTWFPHLHPSSEEESRHANL